MKPIAWGLAGICLLLAAGATARQTPPEEKPTLGQRPFPGLVPNKATAEAIATAMAKPILGKAASHYEFIAKPEGKGWRVEGLFLPKAEPGEVITHRIPVFTIDRASGTASFILN